MLTGTDLIITSWMEAISAAKAEDFIPLRDADEKPHQAWAEATMWAARFFRPDANPFNAANSTRHSCHLARRDTFDLLRHEYIFQEIEVVVTECATFTWVQPHEPGTNLLSVPDNKERITLIGQRVLTLDDAEQPLVFQYPSSIGEGTLFSTNPNGDLYVMSGWRSRVDGLIRDGTVNFLCYKKSGEIGIRDPWQWFDETFRAKIEQKQNKARSRPDALEFFQSTNHHCALCGVTNPEGSRFCNQCGSRLLP